MTDRLPTLGLQPDGDSGHLDEARLSTYLDGEIEDGQRAVIQAHLADCGQCRQMLAELRTLTHLLGDLPTPEPPRSFQLDATMVSVRRVPVEPWFLRYQPTVRRLAAMAAVLLVLVLGADLVVHQTEVTGGSAGPVVMEARDGGGTSAPAGAAPESSTAAPAGDAATGESAPAATTDGQASPADDGARSTDQPAVVPSDAAGHPPSEARAAGPSVWRLVEVGLALVVLWSLMVVVVLPHLRPVRDERHLSS